MANTIIYTKTDEAPALATHSFLPIVQQFVKHADVKMELKDISLAARILSQFPEQLQPNQKTQDALAELGQLAQTPDANIIKLPNISASIPQLKSAISELQQKGYAVPDFPEDPRTSEEEANKKKYSKVLGSAVNPVLREGNSDRRVAQAVKEFAKAHPHSMGEWSQDSPSRVAHMQEGDFYGSERSHRMHEAESITIQLVSENGEKEVLKKDLSLLKGEVIDAAVMSHSSLIRFYEQTFQEVQKEGLLLSLHFKATMMKVSDPILFGAAIDTYFKSVFEKHQSTLEEMGYDSRNGLGDLFKKIDAANDSSTANGLKSDLEKALKDGASLAMVDSDKGITNLHVPSDVIIDASMPAAIRVGGKMWNREGQLQDTVAVIPDRSYASVYQETINHCREFGAFDPTKMGSVANIGLMAKKAQEYGSHDKTFWIQKKGRVQVIGEKGQVYLEHEVAPGDIWRMCQTKDVAIKDWVALAVKRARLTGTTTVFWLDPQRAHDSQLIERVEDYLKDHDTDGLDLRILSPQEATKLSLQEIRQGKDVIAVTGNVLRDYLTDLFPILELGTSAKMLSIVPLLNGGGLFETGAGGSAPKHVQQFEKENHLRWDSLGEFLALAVSLEDLAEKTKNKKLNVLAKALNTANSQFLKNNKSPSRKVGELDTRGSHFFLCFYWAQSLALQTEDNELKEHFAPIAQQLMDHESVILNELNEVQGNPVDVDGYYYPDSMKVSQAMRPSEKFNGLLEKI